MKKAEIVKNSKNSALFLLALLKNANATVEARDGRVWIGPEDLAKKLAPRIREHKASLVRFLLDQDCIKCGSEMASGRFLGSTGRIQGKNHVWERRCSSCGYSVSRELPDFPVYRSERKGG